MYAFPTLPRECPASWDAFSGLTFHLLGKVTVHYDGVKLYPSYNRRSI
jgi:hypothetical protein